MTTRARPVDTENGGAAAKKLKTSNNVGNDKKTYPVGPELLSYLFKLQAGKFGADGKKVVIFVAQRHEKALDVWKGLVKKGFQSCPVMLKADIHQYFGIVDVQDVLSFILSKLGDEALQEKKSLAELSKGVEALEQGQVKDIMAHPVSRKNPFHPVCANYSVLFVIEMLAREKHLHRVPVVNNLVDRRIVNLITQSHILEHLAKNLSILGERANKPLSACPSLFKPVFTCKENDTALSAFKRMANKGVSGLAIVDDNGRLKGALSSRDIRVLGKDLHFFWRLGQTVSNFVKKLRGMSDTSDTASSEEHRPRTIQKAIPSNTLGEVITMLHKNKLHKLYLVDTPSDRNLKGVISIRDILKEIIAGL